MLLLWTLFVLSLIYLFLKCYDSVKEFIRYRIYCAKLPTPIEDYEFINGHFRPMFCSIDKNFLVMRKWNSDEKLYPCFVIYAGPFATGLNVIGPDVIEKITSTTKHLKKADLYKFLDRWLGTGLLTSTDVKWHTSRKILTPAFHFSILQGFISIFNRETKELVQTIESGYLEKPVDVVPLISNLTLHTINETSMGSKLDTKTKEGYKYKYTIYKLGQILFERYTKPWWYFNTMYYYFSRLGWTERQLVKDLHTFTDNVIRGRAANFKPLDISSNENAATADDEVYYKKRKIPMLDLLLNERLKSNAMDDQAIRDEVNTFMFEGHDTTAMSLVFTLMLLACHKDIQDEVHQEIISVLGAEPDKQPSYSDLQEMNFMERCIKESLRLYPSVALIGRVAEEDIDTEVGVIPRGAQMYIHFYDLHRNPKFWPNPTKFDPSRFLPENSRGRHPFSYLPFSAGPRNCIGQRYAILEIKAVLCGILKKFILEPIDTPESLVLIQDLILRPMNGCKVKFILRE